MAQLRIEIRDDELETLRTIASERSETVASVIASYLRYLLAGGPPILLDEELPNGTALAALADRGGAFAWLADEPDIYSLEDGEPVCARVGSSRVAPSIAVSGRASRDRVNPVRRAPRAHP